MGLFSKWWRERDVTSAVEAILDSKLRETVIALSSVDKLTEEKRTLRERVHNLELQAKTLQEEIAQERSALVREQEKAEHKLSLQRERQNQEVELMKADLEAQQRQVKMLTEHAIKGAQLKAKEEATQAAKAQMDELVARQEAMIDKLLEYLPSAALFKRDGGPETEMHLR